MYQKKENKTLKKCECLYIEADEDHISEQGRKVTGDGASWIKSAKNHIVYCKLCMDKYHVAKYINSAANQMLDEKDIAKENIYKYIYGHNKKKLNDYLDEMLGSANNQKPVEDAKKQTSIRHHLNFI